MQLHTCMCVLTCPHACANMCPVTSDGTLASLTYLHACYTKDYIYACGA